MSLLHFRHEGMIVALRTPDLDPKSNGRQGFGDALVIVLALVQIPHRAPVFGTRGPRQDQFPDDFVPAVIGAKGVLEKIEPAVFTTPCLNPFVGAAHEHGVEYFPHPARIILTRQQCVHQQNALVLSPVIEEVVQFRRGRNAPAKVEIQPAREHGIAAERGRSDVKLLAAQIDEMINRASGLIPAGGIQIGFSAARKAPK